MARVGETPLWTLVSSAAEGARVAGAVARDGGLREAGLALRVLLARVVADVLALAEGLLVLVVLGDLVGGRGLDEADRVGEGLGLVGAGGVPHGQVLGDEVAAGLDLAEVVLDGRDLLRGRTAR